MEKGKNNKNIIILLLAIVIIILTALCILLATGTINFKSYVKDNNVGNNEVENPSIEDNNGNEGNNSIYDVCTNEEELYDKLEILDMENKTEKIGAIGGSTKGYNVITTVTREHSYTSLPEEAELYATDYLGKLFVLYKNKVYYTNENEIISKYCDSFNENGTTKLTCDYSKFNDDNIKEFTYADIATDIKSIGSYGDGGSGRQMPYAITSDGKVIEIVEDSNHNYSSCRIMYDSSEYPIDRIFNMYFYDGVEYTILLKNGTLITRDIDRENPIYFEH